MSNVFSRRIQKRNFLISLHGVIGLVMGLLFMIVSLTGGAIVFHKEIDQALNPALWSVTPQSEQLPLEVILENLKQDYPELSVQTVNFPKKADGSYVINSQNNLGKDLQIFVNPYTGQKLGERVWKNSLTGFLYALHYQLLLGKPGEFIVGFVGLMLLIVSITGIILWTGWKKLINGFKLRLKAPLALLTYDIHKVTGIISSLFLLILAVTGIFIIYLLVSPLFSPQAAAEVFTSSQVPLPLTQLLKEAEIAMPDGKITSISWSDKTLTIHKKLPDQKTGFFDLSTVAIDQYTGKILQVNRVLEPPPRFQVLIWVARLHFGTWGGLSSRILYVFLGFSPTLLFLTGLYLWQRKRWIKVRQIQFLKYAEANNQDSL